jgi:High-affinity nickel-transport protein
MLVTAGAFAFGVTLGLRHAFEPDHLTAVSTLVVEARGARRAMVLGALWGVGHCVALALVGTVLIASGTLLPVQVVASFELVVAGMLVVLGVRSLRRAIRDGGRGACVYHRHGGAEHVHAGPLAHLHLAGRPLAWRPALVGLVHGLAGSGSITALVFAELPTFSSRVLYILAFGVGSCVGMCVASGVVGAVVAWRGGAGRERGLAIATGTISIVLGVVWASAALALV